jgi:hypothetical protein
MMDENRELLDKYILRLLELKNARKWQHSEEELEEIALDIGLTKADLALARREVEAHIQRGATYASTRNWADAAEEYETAVELDPISLQTQYQLASFYFLRWNETKKGENELDEAIDKCLQFAPDFAPARDLLLQVRKIHRRRRIWRWLKWTAVAITAPILLLFGAIVLRESGIITPSPSGLEGVEYSVPVEISPIEKGEGIVMVLNRFKIVHDESVYRQRLFDCEYIGRITSDRYEVQKLRYTVDFLDDKDQVVASTYLWLFNASSEYAGDEDHFALHPGDQFLFSGEDGTYLKTDPTRISRVRIHPTRVERVRPPASYPEYPLKSLEWHSQQIDYLAFELRERESAYYNDEFARPRHYLQLEMTHRGTKPCRELVIVIEWVDEEGAVVRDWEKTVVSLAHEPVQPGARLIFNQQEYFDEEEFPAGTRPFSDYRVYIRTAD